MQSISDSEILIARIIRKTDTEINGLNFFSEDSENIQASIWNHELGKVLPSHTHKPLPRNTIGTHEMIFVIKGRLHVDLYGASNQLLIETDLNEGDILICIRGGHGYEILEQNTKILEVKNGPYYGVELDKTTIPNHCRNLITSEKGAEQ